MNDPAYTGVTGVVYFLLCGILCGLLAFLLTFVLRWLYVAMKPILDTELTIFPSLPDDDSPNSDLPDYGLPDDSDAHKESHPHTQENPPPMRFYRDLERARVREAERERLHKIKMDEELDRRLKDIADDT